MCLGVVKLRYIQCMCVYMCVCVFVVKISPYSKKSHVVSNVRDVFEGSCEDDHVQV